MLAASTVAGARTETLYKHRPHQLIILISTPLVLLLYMYIYTSSLPLLKSRGLHTYKGDGKIANVCIHIKSIWFFIRLNLDHLWDFVASFDVSSVISFVSCNEDFKIDHFLSFLFMYLYCVLIYTFIFQYTSISFFLFYF